MRCHLLAAAAVLLLPLLTCAEDDARMHDEHKMETLLLSDAPITITINPEARVSVTLGGALPPPAPCGTAADLLVAIANQGFVTARLEAELVGDVPAGVTIDFHPEFLKGLPQELRKLYVTLTKPGLTDLTIAFRSHNEIPDFGGRDRVHFLLHCLPRLDPLPGVALR
jgi:hypothetical protein